MVLTQKKYFKAGILTLIFHLLAVPGFSEGPFTPGKKDIKSIHALFHDAAEPVLWEIQAAQRESLQQMNPVDCVYKIEDASGVTGYLLLTRAKGRHDYFDYSIIYAPDLSIKQVYVTVYRSTHGAGICNKRWLQQFEGYQGGGLALGADIDAVSGGTISSASMVEDIQRCYKLMSSLLDKSTS